MIHAGAARRTVHLLVPGDLDAPTGGYAYDRRIAGALEQAGWAVHRAGLHGSFPEPTSGALEHAREVLARIPDHARVIVDGLAYGAMPTVAALERDRLGLIALVHHPLDAETGLHPDRVQLVHVSERAALASARAVVTTSATTARALEARYGVEAGRLTVVVPGTDPAPRSVSAGGATRLLCVGAVTARKGHLVLLDALSRIADRDWCLTCAGTLGRDTGTVVRVRRAIDALGFAGRVELTGEVSAAQLEALYARADVFVLATRMEGYGMALAEALAHGVPIVSTRVGAVPETVPDTAGLLVDADDPIGLAAALARLIDVPAQRARLARGARAAGERLPDWPRAVTPLVTLLERLAG